MRGSPIVTGKDAGKFLKKYYVRTEKLKPGEPK